VDEDDGKSLFAEAMGKVQPLTPADKVASGKPKPARPSESIPFRRPPSHSIAQASVALSVQPTSDPWTFVADGMSRERLKRLSAGRPPIERTFDLHGMTRNEALAMLEDACGQASSEGVRVFCIIHGRGLHSQGRAILKEAVYHWLRQGPLAHRVLAIIPQPGSGGGACLLLLRRK
jgi:DNA-nicking Smr family endonuclease